MDNMEKMGFDAELEKDDNVIEMKRSNRPPYASWTVRGVEYKLKLTTSAICRLEEKYKKNLLMVMVDNDGLPPVATMLTVVQAALQKYHHGFTFTKVQDLYDDYVDDGGSQSQMMADTIMPLLGTSGFFTPTQTESMTEAMKDIDMVL